MKNRTKNKMKLLVQDGPLKGQILNVTIVEQDEDQFETSSPYGNVISSNKSIRDGYELSYTLYSKCISYSLRRNGKTLLSGNCWDRYEQGDVLLMINDFVNGLKDPDDIVFELEEVTLDGKKEKDRTESCCGGCSGSGCDN